MSAATPPPSGVIRLVTRGDDSGSAEAANLAVARSCRDGINRNASVMVPGPAFASAARLLHELGERIDVGLHITLNAEWDSVKWGPVLGANRVPSLVDDRGHFLPTPPELADRRPSVEEMMAEVRAQLDRARSAGLDIKYMDTHMGVGRVAGLGERLVRLAEQEGLVYADVLKLRGLPPAPRGVIDPVTEFDARLAAAAAAGGAYLFVTHPGQFDPPDMKAFVHPGLAPGAVAREREAETRLLTAPGTLAAVRARGVRLMRYTELAAGE
jgi:chitin disaccharide deacetylase